jgi:tetratricopeptide (TPR) repeat protein
MYDSARICFVEAIKIAPNFAKAHYNLSILYTENADLDNALKAITNAGNYDTKNPAIWYQTGIIYSRKGQIRNAISFFEKATQYDSTYSDAYYAMAILARRIANGEDPIPPIESQNLAISEEKKQQHKQFRDDFVKGMGIVSAQWMEKAARLGNANAKKEMGEQ